MKSLVNIGLIKPHHWWGDCGRSTAGPLDPKIVEQIKNEIKEYAYGHFNNENIMEKNLENYIDDVKKQLTCNNNSDVEYITYEYSNEQIDEHLDYFKNSMKNGLSGYKALLFF
jgi:hypothetical protein